MMGIGTLQGLNPLFDTFDCQVHFFEGETSAESWHGPGIAPTENSLGRLVGKINWRINEAAEPMLGPGSCRWMANSSRDQPSRASCKLSRGCS